MDRVQNSKKAAATFRTIADDIERRGPLGKIDWTVFFAMLIELLPIIIALFAKPDEEKPAA